MSSVLSDPNQVNPYLRRLQDSSSVFQDSCQCLVISHNDSKLVVRMTQALDKYSAMLQLPQPDWDFENPRLVDAIRWALQSVGVRQIALVGHSAVRHSGTLSENGRQESASGESNHSEQSSFYNRLIAGVTQRQNQIQEAKDIFAEQFLKFLEIPDVQQRREQDALVVHGLFYLADSGVFLSFDAQSRTFHPLMESSFSC